MAKEDGKERAPMCSICENRHYLRQPHDFRKKKKAKVKK